MWLPSIHLPWRAVDEKDGEHDVGRQRDHVGGLAQALQPLPVASFLTRSVRFMEALVKLNMKGLNFERGCTPCFASKLQPEMIIVLTMYRTRGRNIDS